jgi:hypothetical protein
MFFFEFETFSVYDIEDNSSAGKFVLHIFTLQLHCGVFWQSSGIDKTFSE